MNLSEFKVLIVEDDAVPGMYLQRKLNRMGLVVTDIVTTGEMAIEIVKSNPPDLILMDIMLAGELNGIATTYEIRKFSQVPVFFMTGYNEVEIEGVLREIRFTSIFSKPIVVQDIIKSIDSLRRKDSEATI